MLEQLARASHMTSLPKTASRYRRHAPLCCKPRLKLPEPQHSELRFPEAPAQQAQTPKAPAQQARMPEDPETSSDITINFSYSHEMIDWLLLQASTTQGQVPQDSVWKTLIREGGAAAIP